MAFIGLEPAAVARALSQIADRPEDRVDAYFERLETVELPPEEDSSRTLAPGLLVRREEGFAVRLVRDGRSWLASRDGLEPASFTDALRQVARVLPTAAYGEPQRAAVDPLPPLSAEETAAVLEMPRLVARAVRSRHAAFPLRLTVARHRRDVQVVSPRLVPGPEREIYYSVAADQPWGRYGALLPELGTAAAERVADALTASFRARQAAPPAADRVPAVLAPAAAAVLLHEAVAHALEADILALGGHPEAAQGVTLGPPELTVLDDPGRSPGETDRATDDEGLAVTRRYLLREGVVEQPLADAAWAERAGTLIPGAGRRGNRNEPPGPRSTCLELAPGEAALSDLLAGAEGGLYVTQVARGRLDALTGRFRLAVPFARRIRGGIAADAVGPFELTGSVAGLLESVAGVGREVETAGAGWCAKGGQKLPVWARTPALFLARVEVRR